jgi:hypothetical protein
VKHLDLHVRGILRSFAFAQDDVAMPFPDHIARVFDAFGIAADTKDVLYDLYIAMGDEVLEVFGDIAENVDSPATLRPEDCAPIRARVVERYLRRNHPRWAAGLPTPSLYHPRSPCTVRPPKCTEPSRRHSPLTRPPRSLVADAGTRREAASQPRRPLRRPNPSHTPSGQAALIRYPQFPSAGNGGDSATWRYEAIQGTDIQ